MPMNCINTKTCVAIWKECKLHLLLLLNLKDHSFHAGASFRTYGSAESGRSNGDYGEEPAASGLPGPYQIPPEAAPLPPVWPLQPSEVSRAAESLDLLLPPHLPAQVCFLIMPEGMEAIRMCQALD